MLRKLIFALALMATPAAAQSVIEDCSGWQASARNIPEPWEAHIRSFANGAIRVALMDTIEPAAGAFYLMVITPPFDEMGNPVCALIGADQQMGLAGLDFGQMQASYDPASGLTLRLPATRFAPSTGGFDPAILAVTINQATGQIFPRFEIP